MIRQALLAMSRSDTLKRFVTESSIAWRGASRFIAGNTLEQAMGVVADLNAAGLRVTLDYLGENVASRQAAEASRDAYIEALAAIHAQVARSGISLKLTALGLDLGTDLATELLRDVVRAAADFDPPVFVRIDMEGSDYTQRTFDIFYDVFDDYSNLGIVIQSYLYRTDDDVERLISVGAPVRLVKGAYLEPEAIAYPDKADVDAAFVRQAARLLSPEARDKGVYAAIATHDDAIIDWTKGHVAEVGLAQDEFEFQMLHGVRRDLQTGLVDEGYRMRIYVPYGSQWYPYFMRRLAERPENLSFMIRSFTEELRS